VQIVRGGSPELAALAAARPGRSAPWRRIYPCVATNSGDDDVFGAEVNAASKLGEDTAKAWEILVTRH
jgi:hypothetical protein